MHIYIKKTFALLVFYAFAFALLFAFWSALNQPQKLFEPFTKDVKLQSVSYAPFKYNESPNDLAHGFVIPEARLDADLKLLSEHFKSIRIYSVGGLEQIPFYAKKHGLKVMLGIWIGAEDDKNQKEIQTAIQLAKEYSDVISCVIVGNEVLLRRELSSAKLASYIKQVKVALPQTEVTYADVWEFWLENPELTELVDFVTIHILPYWEDTPVAAKEALMKVETARNDVAHILQNKEILIGETGWPSEGKMRGTSSATPYEQATYLRGFLELAKEHNWDYNLIEAFDQPWKRVSEGAVGGYWGIYDKDSLDKNVLFGEVRDFKNYFTLFTMSGILLLISFLLQFKAQRLSATIIFYSFISSILLTLQFNQFLVIPKETIDMLRIGLLFGASFLLYFQLIRLVLAAKVDEGFTTFLLRVLVFLTLIESIYLVFDGRYRSFESFITAFILLSFFVISRYSYKNIFNDAFVKFAAIALMGLSFGLIYVEGVQNIQAIIYALLSFTFGAFLYAHAKNQKDKFISTQLLFILFVAGAVAFWRNEYFVNAEYVLICENAPQEFNCLLRKLMGMLLYHNILGYASLVFALLFALMRKSFIAYLTLASSTIAILFFNASIGVITLVFTLMLFIDKHSENK